MTRKRKTNELQIGLPDTTERSISFESGIDFNWGVDIGKATPPWEQNSESGGTETDKGTIKAFIRQVSFGGTVYSYVIQIPLDSKLWRKLPKKRKTRKTGHKTFITVVK